MQGWVWRRRLTPEPEERGPRTEQPQAPSRLGVQLSVPLGDKGTAFLQRGPTETPPAPW